MATKIPLNQRTELPPTRAGIAKTPYELADRPERQFGQALARFGGDIFDKLVKAQAANEEAEARGQVNTLIESFSTFVADRPNASPEELQKEWDKISARIKALPGTLKTKIAKANFTNFLALNEGLISQRALTSMEAIKSKQELGRFNAGRERAITEFDIPGLTAIYEAQFESGLLDEETGRIQLENDIAVIEEQAAIHQKQTVLETVAEAARTMPLNDALYYINAIPRTSITETERNGLITQRKRQEEIATASHNDGVYWDTLRKLTKDRDSISEEELEALVGPDSLSVDDWKELVRMKDPTDPLSKPSVKTALTLFDNLKTMGAFVGKDPKEMTLAEKRENAQTWADIKNDFIKWVEANPDATEDQIERKQKALVEPEREEFKLNWWSRFWRMKRRRAFGGLVLSEEELLAEKKKKSPSLISAKERTARKGRIRRITAPLNIKYKTKLQPSLLDDTSDKFQEIWLKLDDDKKMKVWQALNNGYTERQVLAVLE